MSEPIYKLFIFKRFTDAWYQLPKEEQDRIFDSTQVAEKELGREFVLLCNSSWANEGTMGWGIAKYPNIEAVQQFAAQSEEWLRYIECETILGIPDPRVPEPSSSAL
jgi:hypothetical protein